MSRPQSQSRPFTLKFLIVLGLAVLLNATAPVSHAALVTHVLTGTVTSVDGALAPTFQVGQAVTYNITFDDATPDSDASAENGGYDGALKSASGTIGCYAFSGTNINANMSVSNNHPFVRDQLTVNPFTPTGNSVNGIPPGRLQLFLLQDSTQTAVASTLLSELPPGDLSEFDGENNNFSFLGVSNSKFIFWTITSWQVGSLPAASTTPDLVAASDTGSSNTDNLTSDDTPTFSGTAGAGATVELFRDGCISLGTGIAVGGTWSITAATIPPGTYNIIANVTSAGITSIPSSALVITVESAVPPTLTMAFSPTSIALGGVSTLTFTINNGTSTADATALNLTANLPIGMTIAATPNATSGCAGGTLTAVAGATQLQYTGGTVATGSTCTVSVNITSKLSGASATATGNLTSNLGVSAGALANLAVVAPEVVPTLTEWGIIGLTLILALAAVFRVRRLAGQAA